MTLKEAKKVFYQQYDASECAITKVWDFDWGVVFAWNSRMFVETGNHQFALLGNSPILVDKITGELISFCKLETPKRIESMDLVLERYRQKKGYPFAIKYSLPKKFNELTTIQQVFSLIETGEHYHIRKAIDLINNHDQLDLDSICNILQVNPKNDLIEELAINRIFLMGGEYMILYIPFPTLSPAITPLKESITSIFAMSSLLEELPNEIVQLGNLTHITITECPLIKMPFDLSPLTKLQGVDLNNTYFKEEQQNHFILPEGCELKITGKYQDWMFESRF